MFQIGDVIVYGAQGICRIDCVETKQIAKLAVDYYVLKPIFNANTAVFVPVDNDTLTSKMQNVLTKEQADRLLESADDIALIDAQDDNTRRELYRSILSSGDRSKLISLIKTLRFERDTRRDNGKKLNINDEQLLRKAELLVANELAYIFDIEQANALELLKF